MPIFDRTLVAAPYRYAALCARLMGSSALVPVATACTATSASLNTAADFIENFPGRLPRLAYADYVALKQGLKTDFGLAARSWWLAAKFMQIANPLMADTFRTNAELAEFLAMDFQRHPLDFRGVTLGHGGTDFQETPVGYYTHYDLYRIAPLDKKVDIPARTFLVFMPMSGYGASLIKPFLRKLLPHGEVYVADPKNARDVPASLGPYSLERQTLDFADMIQETARHSGRRPHIAGISQSTVPAVAALCLMQARDMPDRPLSAGIFIGPLDCEAGPGGLSELARQHAPMWFHSLLQEVPAPFAGEGRRVLAGHDLYAAHIMKDMVRHMGKIGDLWSALHFAADEIIEAHSDGLAAKFAYQDCDGAHFEDMMRYCRTNPLARGAMVADGTRLDTAALRDVGLMTMAAGKDELVHPAQVGALVSGMTPNIEPSLKRHMEVGEAGHYPSLLDPGFQAQYLRFVGDTECALLPAARARQAPQAGRRAFDIP